MDDTPNIAARLEDAEATIGEMRASARETEARIADLEKRLASVNKIGLLQLVPVVSVVLVICGTAAALIMFAIRGESATQGERLAGITASITRHDVGLDALHATLDDIAASRYTASDAEKDGAADLRERDLIWHDLKLAMNRLEDARSRLARTEGEIEILKWGDAAP